MKWLVDVLERNGIVPSAHIAEQIIEALPLEHLRQILRESADATLRMYGGRGNLPALAARLGETGAASVVIALTVGDGDDAELEKRVIDLWDRGRRS